MSGEPTNVPRVSILRIVGALFVAFGLLWFALPFWSSWFFAAPGMPEEDVFLGRHPLLTPWPYVGAIVVLFGLGFLGIARGGWLIPTIVALVVWVVVLIIR